MGSMKRKRRKKQAKEWTEFQQLHHLSDECLKLARETGYPLKILKEKLANSAFDEAMSMADRIGEINRQWQCRLATRQARIESGEIKPKPKKSWKELAHDPQWAKAKQVCRLNMEEIRMAKELGMTPKSLMKNVPGSTQSWKAPVKVWVRDLYEQRQRRSHSGPSSEPATSETLQPQIDEDIHRSG
jgi:hypothetical protein